MKSLLVEIGCEEIPARMVAPAAEQLNEQLKNWIATSTKGCLLVR